MFLAVSAPNYSIPYSAIPHFYWRNIAPTSSRISVKASWPNSSVAKLEYTPWLVVGLGNPGNKYHGTRHNVGFEMIDCISRREGIILNTIQSKTLIGIGSIGVIPILFAKPQAYMGFSGDSISLLAAYYKIPLRHILLIYDEMGLPNGVIKLQPKGGHSFHNGVKSVIESFDDRRDFPRLRIGVGLPPGTMDMKAFLLQKFSKIEREQVDAALEEGADAFRSLLINGFDDSIERFNLRQKYKFHKVGLIL